MSWTTESLEAHMRDFFERTMSRERWSPHASHIAATVWHLRRYSADETLVRMRESILAFNRVHGIEHLYHETVTRFYVRVIAAVIARLDRGQETAELANQVIAELGSGRDRQKLLWAEYYSEPDAVIASEEARQRWVPPDRKPVE